MTYAALSSQPYTRRGVSKAVLVYDDLRASIVSLAIKPGARIDKNQLCDRLHVSRQPLAEAISRLAEERLVEVEPQKGTFVARIRLADVSEAAFVRRALEVATVEAVAPAIDDLSLNRLDRVLSYQAAALKAKDWEEFYALDLRFHALLFDRLAMRRVPQVVESSRAQLERIRRLLLPTPRPQPEHVPRASRRLCRARPARSGKAGKAMATHLDEVMAELRRFAARQPDLFET